MTKKFRGTVTLCWVCQNCFGGCSWSRDYIPVEGWKAKTTLVLSCPEFLPEGLLCTRCFWRRDCDYSPLQAGTSGLVADCAKFAPENPEFLHLSLKVLDETEKKGEVQKNRGGRHKKAIQQWSNDRTVHIKDFESLSAAAREVGGTTTHLARVCDGKWKSAKGYWWRWSRI